jgi:hypothetical protein
MFKDIYISSDMDIEMKLRDENIFFSILTFNPKDRANMSYRNVGELISNCMDDITL